MSPRPEGLQSKYRRLEAILAEMGSVLTAFSGGVDSTLLLKAAKDVLGKNVLAVIARSETYPEREVRAAVALARTIGVREEHLACTLPGSKHRTSPRSSA